MIQKVGQKTVYLVRHGHVQMPDNRKYYLGRTDVLLSAEGKRQAEWLQRFFQDKDIQIIYHSPLKRCMETAQILSEGRISCVSVPELMEIDMGSWEMLPMEQVKTQYPEMYQLRGELIDTFCPPGGESFKQCQERTIDAFQELVNGLDENQSVVVVAHAGVNRCILSWLKNQSLKELLTIPQPYACITKLELRNERWTIKEDI